MSRVGQQRQWLCQLVGTPAPVIFRSVNCVTVAVPIGSGVAQLVSPLSGTTKDSVSLAFLSIALALTFAGRFSSSQLFAQQSRLVLLSLVMRHPHLPVSDLLLATMPVFRDTIPDI